MNKILLPAKATRTSMTLLEIMVAATVLAIMFLLTMSYMMEATQEMNDTTKTAFSEANVEMTADMMLETIRESALMQLTLYRFTEPVGATLELPDGSVVTPVTQVAIVFPTPRNTNDQYVVSSGGQILSSPAWQGILVYAPYNETVCEYIDRNNHPYDDANPIGITSITATTITLTDGTTFPRDGSGMGAPGSGSVRTFRELMPDVAQIEVTIAAFPASTMGFYNPGGFAFPIKYMVRDPEREASAGLAGLIPVRQLVEIYPRMRN